MPQQAHPLSLSDQWCIAQSKATAASEVMYQQMRAGHPFAVWGLADQVRQQHQAEADRIFPLAMAERNALLYPAA